MELPARLGKYELLQYLGGGMSHVYKARDTIIGRTVAVKILTEQGVKDADAKARFLREAQTAGNIAHENILRVYDFGEQDGKPFMVMEFLTGEDLRAAIKNGHTGDLANKLRIAIDSAAAIEHVHEAKIIHRDIKPDNVYITSTGAVKLVDFGIAKQQELHLTRTGFSIGTPYYMAPEQVLGKDVTHLVDVYGFGVMLFELFTGVKPIQAESIETIFYKILHEPLDLSPLEVSATPAPVRDLIRLCTEKRPEDRPQSFREIRERLQSILDTLSRGADQETVVTPVPPPSASPPPPAPEKHEGGGGTRRILIALGIAIVLLGAVAAFLALRGGPETEPVSGQESTPAELPATLDTPAGRMVLVKSGEFLSQADKHTAVLPAFYVDETEVPNSAWAKFLEAKGRAPSPDFTAALTKCVQCPVTGISVEEAREFAGWAEKRLPRMLEWEKAARGTQGWEYPWGDSPDPSKANVRNNPNSKGELAPVDAYPQSASPWGAIQMVGNAWELVDDSVEPSSQALAAFRSLLKPPATAQEPWVRIAGGAFDQPLPKGAAFDFAAIPARFHSPSIGFRCVRPAPGGQP